MQNTQLTKDLYDDDVRFFPSSVRKTNIPLENRQNLYTETSMKKRYGGTHRDIQPRSKTTYSYTPLKRGERES